MKVAIIGAGNMGGAIARGLAQGTIIPASDVTVADPFSGNLETLQADYPEIRVTTENPKAIEDADIVILAVKPWLIDQILSVIRLEPRQVLVSIAGGVTFEQLVNSVGPEQTIFRLIPNTAISERQSMTLIASRNASKEQEQLMLDIFNELGMAMLIPESQMGATTALTSCGIAYVLKYIQAAMQAGIEMGVTWLLYVHSVSRAEANALRRTRDMAETATLGVFAGLLRFTVSGTACLMGKVVP